MRQRTVADKVEFSGQGLHTGHKVKLTLKPAAEDHGIVFVKSSGAQLKVTVENAQGVARGTKLEHESETLYTCEHLMAALGAHGITNADVELDADEPPVLDGSSWFFYEKIKEAGFREQMSVAPQYRIVKTCVVEDEGSILVASPAEDFHISYTVDYPGTAIGTQRVDFDVNQSCFDKLLKARTFCLLNEVEAMQKNGLAIGGSLQNAVVVDGDKILNEEGLRFENEFAWHKALDLFGNLRVLGGVVKGRFTGFKSGHRQNIALLKKLFENDCVVQENDWMEKKVLELVDIKKLLPHRYPFLLVDRVIEMEPGKSARGIKNVTGNEEFFNGHFPDNPVMPGVLIVEAMAQVAGICLLAMTDNSGKTPYFMALEQVKFRKPVYPGDQLELCATVDRLRSSTGKVSACAKVNGTVHVEGKLSFILR